MPRSTILTIALATLSAIPATLVAQNAYVAGSGNNSDTQSQAAPIERSTPYTNDAPDNSGAIQNNNNRAASVINAQPEQGVLLRYQRNASVHTVASDESRTEIRVDRGIANVDVYHPVTKGLILVDLPGGQTQLLKDGLYTFNASTNTVRVMHGEADAFPAASPKEKPIKVKENHQVSFVGNNIRSTSFDDYQASVDLLAIPQSAYAGNPEPGYGYAPYGYGPYGDGFYGGYPYFAYGYPFWGYGPFGYGLGFGYYGGGFYRGGYGYGGGFRGGYGGGYGGGFHGGGYGGGGGFHGGGGGGGRR